MAIRHIFGRWDGVTPGGGRGAGEETLEEKDRSEGGESEPRERGGAEVGTFTVEKEQGN